MRHVSTDISEFPCESCCRCFPESQVGSGLCRECEAELFDMLLKAQEAVAQNVE